MRNAVLSLALSLPLVGCSSLGGQLADVVFIPNARSAKVLDEAATLEIAYARADPNRSRISAVGGGDEKFTPSFVAGALAPVLAGAVVDQIGKSLATEAERYQATFSADAGGDQFYFRPYPTAEAAPAATPRKTDVRFAGFKLTRMAKDDSAIVHAMTICMIALPGSTDNFFYLVPVSYDLNLSKAKVVAFDMTSPFGVDILNPWEILTDPLFNGGFDLPPGDDDIDMKISISLENMFFDDAGKLNITNTSAEAFDIKGAQLGKGSRYFPGYIAFLEKLGAGAENYEMDCDQDTSADEIATLRSQIASLEVGEIARMTLTAGGRAFPSPKRSVPKGDSNANFLLRAVVEETDEYSARVKELAAAFEKEKPNVQKGITDFLDGEK